jgi:hypothetical protein
MRRSSLAPVNFSAAGHALRFDAHLSTAAMCCSHARDYFVFQTA